jgi:hypothetical protein
MNQFIYFETVLWIELNVVCIRTQKSELGDSIMTKKGQIVKQWSRKHNRGGFNHEPVYLF